MAHIQSDLFSKVSILEFEIRTDVFFEVTPKTSKDKICQELSISIQDSAIGHVRVEKWGDFERGFEIIRLLRVITYSTEVNFLA